MARLFPPGYTFFKNGAALDSGTVTFYTTGTTDKKDTYPTSTLSGDANANPITLNSSGQLPVDVHGSGEYTVLIQDVNGATVESRDSSGVDASTTYYKPVATAVNRLVSARLYDKPSVKDFGATGDGSTDDTTAIQAAIDAVGIGGSLHFPAGIYITSDTLKVNSRTLYYGDGHSQAGTVIRNTTSDAPIIASKNYFSAESISPSGWCQIKNLRVEGTNDVADTSNHGILLRDYYSVIEDVEVYQTGADGIVLAQADDAAASPSSLVENKLTRCVVREAGGDSYRCADTNGSVVTDGHMTDCISQSPADAHFDGWWAGWKMHNIHGYGGTPSIGFRSKVSFDLQMSNIRIASSVDFGFVCSGMSRTLQVTNLELEFDSNNASYVAVTLSKATGATPQVQIVNCKLRRETGTNAYTAFSIGADTTLDFGRMLPIFEGSTIATSRTMWANSGTVKGFQQAGIVQMSSGTASVTFDLPMADGGYGLTFGSDTAGNINWSSNTATGFTITHSGGGTEFVGWATCEL